MQPMNRSDNDVASKDRRNSIYIFGTAFAIYVLLRSRFYIGDGVRYLPVALGATMPKGGGNSHFLWPCVLWLVCRASAALGILPIREGLDAREGLIALLQGINSFAGALGLVLLYRWIRGVATRRAALIAVALTGLSHAFLLHATDMTEPMMAVAPMMAGLCLLGWAPDRTWARLGAGALIGFGGDFYQIALIAVAPATWLAARSHGSVTLAERFRRLVRAGIEIGGGSVAVYAGVIAGVRFALSPGAHLTEELASVRTVNTAGGLAGSIVPKHFAAWIFGFANALAPIRATEGISRLFQEPARDVFISLAILVLALAFLAGLVLRLVRSRQILGQLGRWPDIQAALGWFALVVFMVCAWSVLYEKFWVFALLPLSMVVALAIDPHGDEPAAVGDPGGPRRLMFLVPAAVLVVVNMATGAIPRRYALNPDVRGLALLADRLRTDDLLVCPGWDVLSVYVRTLLELPVDVFDVTDEAIAGHELASGLRAKVAATIARGGRVYFLALVDLSHDEWDLFYGSRLHVPFELLDPYRTGSLAIEQLPGVLPESLYEFKEGGP
jgi:hypothetical protein